MPIERSDLADDTQEVLSLYDFLPAKWDTMSGYYMGKDYNLLPVLFEEFHVDTPVRLYAWRIIPYIDSLVAEDVAEKIKRKTKELERGSNSKSKNTS